ncbi:MAG: hypothetical protein CL535_16605 [Ahrensia sp.]|nr:hypothetical protein [Ahrensia sp.]MBV48196.1 hypothetical protein [Roseobacter sp.]MBV48297.1 hypothetical protein [Roseobacter sp.]|tara:strand:+ start:155368 stop:156489 length:1122 start_codon:yes stop_codon:yes gene_type:complete
MTHPTITHIDDVLPSVKDRTDFVVVDKGDYTVIDYVYALPDSFDDPIRRECRGIKFARDGSILARPFHKFFNIGEREETQPAAIDFNEPHSVTEKLDGTMIHAAFVNGVGCFMTRMGRTDHALRAERHFTRAIERECAILMHGEHPATPIFEWTAPDNRIVVRYEESALTLLAIRRNEDGHYYPRAVVEDWAKDMGIPHVAHHTQRHNSAADFLAYARAIQGAEGFVVRFDSGLWVKAKGEDYVLKHRAKDSIMHEKNILALVLSGGIDDVLPLLDDADADAVREYATAVELGIAEQAEALWAIIADNDNGYDRKTFATTVVPRLHQSLRPLAFQIYDGVAPRQAITERLAANCNSQTQVDAYRPLHGAVWRY